jgi:hypothetical protein
LRYSSSTQVSSVRYLAKFQMANSPSDLTMTMDDEQLVNKVKVGPACEVGDSGDADGPSVPFTGRSLN